MAYGYEVVFGFRGFEYEKLKSLIDLDLVKSTLEDEDSDLFDLFDVFEGFFSPTNKKLSDVFPSFLNEYGFNVLGKSDRDYIVAETPSGLREFSPIKLEFYFDPHEFDEKFEDSVIGFTLSGRYVPTFLDWENPSGALWNFSLDDKTLKMIEFAKKRIIEISPIFSEANIIFREVHY